MAPDIEPYRSRQRFKHMQVPKNLKNESDRLKTFINWTVSFLDSKKLAKGGFYYTNKEDTVKCAYCQVEIDSWEQGDVPEKKHKRLSPNCPAVAGEDEESQTQSETVEDKRENEEVVPSEDVCGPYGVGIRPFPVSRRQAPDVVQEENGSKTEPHSFRSRFQDLEVPENFKNVSERLKTFINLTVSFLDSKKLAKSGFYYTNENDIIKCAFCGVEIGLWNYGDILEKVHKRSSPDCPIVKSQSHGSQTRSESGQAIEENKEDPAPSQDVCGDGRMEIRPFSAPERPGKTPFNIESCNLWKNFEDIGVFKIGRPVYPQYVTYNARLKTFEKWPIPEIQAPEKLAEAGFYYKGVGVGQGDQVMCFHCGGGLHNWEVDDDPWFDHARWFSKCAFVILQKGREFINEVCAKGLLQFPPPNAKGSENIGEVAQKTQKAEQSMTPQISVTPSLSSSTSVSDKESQPSQSPKSDTKGLELCRVCYMKEREIVFLPCGHFISCTQCALSLSKCAVCRKPFEATVRAYLS